MSLSRLIGIPDVTMTGLIACVFIGHFLFRRRSGAVSILRNGTPWQRIAW